MRNYDDCCYYYYLYIQFATQGTPQGNLICWYHGLRDPLLMFRPIKVEMVWRKPRILIFRDLVSSIEAERIKAVAKPMVCCCLKLHPTVFFKFLIFL